MTGNLKIIHDKYSEKLKQVGVREAYRNEFQKAAKSNEQLQQHLDKVGVLFGVPFNLIQGAVFFGDSPTAILQLVVACRLLSWSRLVNPQAADDLNPVRVLNLFRAISNRDCELLDLASRPEV